MATATAKAKNTARRANTSLDDKLKSRATEVLEHTIALRLAPTMLQKIDALAEKHGVDRSTVIRTILEDAL